MNDTNEIERLRAEVAELNRINMNLRYLIPRDVWLDEANRLRGDNQESPANEIERLRDEVDTLTELLADALPKLVERLKLINQVAQLRAELAATKTPGTGYLTAGDL